MTDFIWSLKNKLFLFFEVNERLNRIQREIEEEKYDKRETERKREGPKEKD